MSHYQERKQELKIDGREIRDRLRALGRDDEGGTGELSSERLAAMAKDTVRAGNERRLVVRNAAGEIVLDLPLTLGILVSIARPRPVAVAAVAALALNCAISLEKRDES